jgi:hypothetical protein
MLRWSPMVEYHELQLSLREFHFRPNGLLGVGCSVQRCVPFSHFSSLTWRQHIAVRVSPKHSSLIAT